MNDFTAMAGGNLTPDQKINYILLMQVCINLEKHCKYVVLGAQDDQKENEGKARLEGIMKRLSVKFIEGLGVTTEEQKIDIANRCFAILNNLAEKTMCDLLGIKLGATYETSSVH